MSTLAKLFWAVVVFLVTWFVVWAIAYVLEVTGVPVLVQVGSFLDAIDWLVGLVCGVLYFVTGESWVTNRKRF